MMDMDPAVVFKCEPCNKSFASSKSLNSHFVMSSVHNGIQITCGMCSATFKRKFYLAKHYQDKHHDLVRNVPNYVENQPEPMSTSTALNAQPVDLTTGVQASTSKNDDVAARLDDGDSSENDMGGNGWGENCNDDDDVCVQALEIANGNGGSSLDVAKKRVKKKNRNDKHTSEYRFYLQASPGSNVFELYVKMAYDNPVVYDFEWRQTTNYPSTSSSTSQTECGDHPSAPCCLECRHSLIERIGELVSKSKNSENDKDPLNDSKIIWLLVEAHNEGILNGNKQALGS